MQSQHNEYPGSYQDPQLTVGQSGIPQWENSAFEIQNDIESSEAYIGSLEGPSSQFQVSSDTFSGGWNHFGEGGNVVIGADGNEDPWDNDLASKTLQSELQA